MEEGAEVRLVEIEPRKAAPEPGPGPGPLRCPSGRGQPRLLPVALDGFLHHLEEGVWEGVEWTPRQSRRCGMQAAALDLWPLGVVGDLWQPRCRVPFPCPPPPNAEYLLLRYWTSRVGAGLGLFLGIRARVKICVKKIKDQLWPEDAPQSWLKLGENSA